MIEKYPIEIEFQGKINFAVWVSGDKIDYLITENSKKKIKIWNTIYDLENDIKHIGKSETIAKFNIDKFSEKIECLSENINLTSTSCNEIIDIWNLIEDINNSIQSDIRDKTLNTQSMNDIYEKFFRGCNLPAITSDANVYSPIFSGEEINEFRSTILSILNYYGENSILN